MCVKDALVAQPTRGYVVLLKILLGIPTAKEVLTILSIAVVVFIDCTDCMNDGDQDQSFLVVSCVLADACVHVVLDLEP